MSELALHGGPKACDHTWPSWPVWDDRERDALTGVLESGKWWYGEKVREFEAAFAAFQDAKFGVTATSGTTAIEIGLLALGIGAGDEVIIPPYTFMATASTVMKVNAVPVFADIEGHSLCLDPDDVERKITGRTKAIMPVHLAGCVADMDRLQAIAGKHGLAILEDACHSWGSKWKGKGTGAIGDCGAFSFQASKNITSAEGGILLTDDEAIADAARSYSNVGRGKGGPWYKHFRLGSNLRMTEFQAALLLAQLSRLEEQTLRRIDNARILEDGLRGIPGIRVQQDDERTTRRGYHMFAFRIGPATLGVQRDAFLEALTAEGVPAGPGYPIPLYKNPVFENAVIPGGRSIDYSQVCCPVTEAVCADSIWIMHQNLLAPAQCMHDIVVAVRKVVEGIGSH